jgi:hypothetical protein
MSIWNNPPIGFRMMKHDLVAFAACAAFVAYTWPHVGEWALVAPFVLGNFFLFCNVFRLHCLTELAWSAVFIVNSAAWLWVHPSLAGIFLTQLPFTCAAIGYTVRSPTYRGVMAGSLR